MLKQFVENENDNNMYSATCNMILINTK